MEYTIKISNKSWAQNQGRECLPTFSLGETLMHLFPELLHDTKSIFRHQVSLFCFYYHLKSVETNLRGLGE